MNNKSCLIAGCGGFIGGHLIKYLTSLKLTVYGVDIKSKHEWFQHSKNVTHEIFNHDLSKDESYKHLPPCDYIFNLASNMGGIGYLSRNKARSMLNSTINNKLLEFALKHKSSRYFFSSSANVYPHTLTNNEVNESQAYPANPEDGYGWEKLFAERMCRHFYEDFGLETRVARFFNIYGPNCDYNSGRERVIGALCRKICEIKFGRDKTQPIEIWGDGTQTRNFTNIEDCINGILMVTFGDYSDPTNIGSTEVVTINQLLDYLEKIAHIKLNRSYKLDAPTNSGGVCKSSDNAQIHQRFNWEPSIPLQRGLEATYKWIEDNYLKHYKG